MATTEKKLDFPFFSEEGFADWFKPIDSVYYCRFDLSQYEDAYFDHYIIHMPENIKNSVPKRKAEFFSGRYCAKQSLKTMIRFPKDIGIGKNRNPLWPDDIIGSISHCNTTAVAVIADSSRVGGIGIDIENTICESTIKNIRPQVVQQDEVKLFINAQYCEPTIFTIIFSLKEAFFKAAYPTVQHYFDFDAVTILRIDTETYQILFKLNYDLHETLEKGMLFRGAFHLIDDLSLATLVTLPKSVSNAI